MILKWSHTYLKIIPKSSQNNPKFIRMCRHKRLRPHGGGPSVLRPEPSDENVTTGNTGSILWLPSGKEINSFLAIQTLPVFPVVIYSEQA